MKIAIITTGDYLYAGNIFLKAKKMGYDIYFIDVFSRQKHLYLKKIKLAFLFGFFRTFRLLLASILNKRRIKHNNDLIKIEQCQIKKYISNSDYNIIMLINYAWLFPLDTGKIVFNCHPSLLPMYRGLMPIPYAVNKSLIANTNIITGITIHTIDENYDMGLLVWQKELSVRKEAKLHDVYRRTYNLILDSFEIILQYSKSTKVLPRGKYYKSMSFMELIFFKKNLLLVNKFVRFLINGGIIGLISWLIQIALYWTTVLFLPSLNYKVAISVYISFIIALFINFHALKKYVFKSGGLFYRFVVITTFMITIVGLVSEIISNNLSSIYPNIAPYIAYPLGALIIAPVSFFFKNRFVFIVNDTKTKNY